MTVVLDLQSARTEERAPKARKRSSRSAEIVIFPGVRIDRSGVPEPANDDTTPPGKAKGRRRPTR